MKKSQLENIIKDVINETQIRKLIELAKEIGFPKVIYDAGEKTKTLWTKDDILEEHEETKDPKLEKLLKDFREVGYQQRARPEHLMGVWQEKLGGGVLSYCAEHIGDLSHRASLLTPWGEPMGYEYINEKVAKTLRTLTNPYGFDKERLENLAANATVRYMDANPKIKREYDRLTKRVGDRGWEKYGEEEWDKRIEAKRNFWWTVQRSPAVRKLIEVQDMEQRKAGKDYADAHRNDVHPLTTLQKLGWLAAINLGEYKFNETIGYLKQIKARIEACKTKEELDKLYFEGYNPTFSS